MHTENPSTKAIHGPKHKRTARFIAATLLVSAATVIGASAPASAFTDAPGGGTTGGHGCFVPAWGPIYCW